MEEPRELVALLEEAEAQPVSSEAGKQAVLQLCGSLAEEVSPDVVERILKLAQDAAVSLPAPEVVLLETPEQR